MSMFVGFFQVYGDCFRTTEQYKHPGNWPLRRYHDD